MRDILAGGLRLILKTKHKILMARVLYRILRVALGALGLNARRLEVERMGVRWSLDLSEAIDLSIFLLGSFEKRTVSSYRGLIPPGAVVVDVGANIGAHTLMFAECVGPRGKVYAFEPTSYAFHKLQRNIGNNPSLSPRIVAQQAMLVSGERKDGVPPEIYSSWPLLPAKGLHHSHGGAPKKTDGASAVSLDEALRSFKVDRVDFVKIDVDGYEFEMIRGAKETISRFKPIILIEFAPALADEKGESFELMLQFFLDQGYRVLDAITWRPFVSDAPSIRKKIPKGSSRNVILMPASVATPPVEHMRLRNKRAISRFYREIYRRYQDVLDRCPEQGGVVELGSGAGFAKLQIPELLTSDIVKYPMVDLQVDARALPFESGSLRAILLWNCFHHISDAGLFFEEAVRCLKPGGRMLVIDPYLGWVSRWIYGLHHEALDESTQDWKFQSQSPGEDANIALAGLVFIRDRKKFEELYPQLRISRVMPHSPLMYWFAGGLKSWTLIPGWMSSPWISVDQALSRICPASGSFMDIEVVRVEAPRGD